MFTTRHPYFLVLAARKTYLITARARKNKRTARMLASARKDHSIPLLIHLKSFLEKCWADKSENFLVRKSFQSV